MTLEGLLAPPRPRAAIEVVANFGIVIGRDATAAEVERLATALLAHAPAVTVVAEHRYDVGERGAGRIHQIRVEIDEVERFEVDAVEDAVAAEIERWAEACAREPAGNTLAERLARDAVVNDER